MITRLLAPSMLAFAMAGPALGADGLGRLFFTPSERERLDARRRDIAANPARPAQAPVAEAPAPPPSLILTLNGVVQRSDGDATVWINGQAVNSRFGTAGITPGGIGRDSVGMSLPGSGKRARLKVGQSVESLSGVVEESYRRRRTLVLPSQDPPSPSAPGEPDPSPAPESARKSAPVPAKPDGSAFER